MGAAAACTTAADLSRLLADGTFRPPPLRSARSRRDGSAHRTTRPRDRTGPTGRTGAATGRTGTTRDRPNGQTRPATTTRRATTTRHATDVPTGRTSRLAPRGPGRVPTGRTGRLATRWLAGRPILVTRIARHLCLQVDRKARQQKRTRAIRRTERPSSQIVSGDVLLSHAVARAVPSALRGLASGFGMGPGVSLSLWSPKLYGDICPSP